MKKKTIYLPKGGELEVELTPRFLDAIAKSFEITNHEDITDDHMRMFIYGAFKNAIENVDSAD